MEDRWLVLECKRGSTDALQRIYKKYRNDLLILAIALLNDTAAAEDILHDVFLSFVQQLDRFRLTGSLKAYLATCVANAARNNNRTRQTKTVPLENTDCPGADCDQPLQTIICSEQLQQLAGAMAQLPHDQREVLILHLQTGMKFKAIAESLKISPNTAKSRHRYALEKLRKILNPETPK